MSTGLCARESRAEDRSPLSITIATVCFAPHRLGRNEEGQLRVPCYQYGGESESGLKPAGSKENWRCIALDKLGSVELLEGKMTNRPQPTTTGILRR
jgi:hypothetical protein